MKIMIKENLTNRVHFCLIKETSNSVKLKIACYCWSIYDVQDIEIYAKMYI